MNKVKVHQLKIDFNVTPEIRRYVYVYIIEAEFLYLIDSGVYGCEEQIIRYLKQIGRDISSLKCIFLTHSHPDHIGSLSWFQANTECRIYAGEKEKQWIEDIDLQFKERPIPNFYSIAGKSAKVDVIIHDGDHIVLEAGLSIDVIRTAGHSADGMSFCIGDKMFIGDAVPVKSDIPIIINEPEMKETIHKLAQVTGVETFYPAWDTIYSNEMMKEKLTEADELLSVLKNAVASLDNGQKLPELVDMICNKLDCTMMKSNPLFATTINCLRERV